MKSDSSAKSFKESSYKLTGSMAVAAKKYHDAMVDPKARDQLIEDYSLPHFIELIKMKKRKINLQVKKKNLVKQRNLIYYFLNHITMKN